MKKQLEQIAEFNRAFDIEEYDHPTMPASHEADRRFYLLQEELNEYRDAIFNDDLTEVADALTDIAYVLCGVIRLHGLQDCFTDLFNEVHKTNMAKLHNGKVVKNHNNKVIKPKGWQPPQLEKIIKSHKHLTK